MRVRSPDDATSRINTNCMPGALRAVGTLGDREAPDLKLTKVQGPRAQGRTSLASSVVRFKLAVDHGGASSYCERDSDPW